MTEALRAEGLSAWRLADGVPLVEDVDLVLRAGQALGLCGESGSGKSLVVSVMGDLLPRGLGSRADVRIHGAPHAPGHRRGKPVGVMFQDSHGVFHPALELGKQLAQVARVHGVDGSRHHLEEAVGAVGLDARVLRSFPHQLSGGMLQRLQLAQALLPGPSILLADEPTTALDVTVQARVLDLLDTRRKESGLALLLVSHDLGVVARHAERVAVMYAGRVVEEGPTSSVLARPAHPYTRALLQCRPPLPPEPAAPRLPVIPGEAPPPGSRTRGCSFSGRCSAADQLCREVRPELRVIGTHRRVACHHPLAGAA